MMPPVVTLQQRLLRFKRDSRGASAVEFAIVAMPFFMLLLALPQMAIYFMTQSALDSGIVKTADSLVNTYYSGTTPVAPTPASLEAMVTSYAGGMVRNDATLSVELRKLSALGSATVPVGNTVDASAPKDILVLRGQVFVTTIIGTMSVQSSAIVRRQGL